MGNKRKIFLLKNLGYWNQGHGYSIELPLQGSEELPPLDSSVYVKWTEEGEEPPGWYRARVDEYFGDCSCRIIYDDSLEVTVAEIVNFVSVEWLPCSQRAKKFVPLASTPSTLKSKWKPSLKYYRSLEHSIIITIIIIIIINALQCNIQLQLYMCRWV